jgi:hypothetical protein
MYFFLSKGVKKDVGSSKTSTEVKKPIGVKIKTEVDPHKPKVHKFSLQISFRPLLLNTWT